MNINDFKVDDDFVNKVNLEKENKTPYFDEKCNYTIEDIGSSYYEKLKIKDKCPIHRLSYEVIWDEKYKKRIVFILFNPSTANGDKLDGTLKNCVKIYYRMVKNNKSEKCGGMIIYNTFTVRHPDIKEALNMLNVNYEYNNNPVFNLEKHLKNYDVSHIVVAWGNTAKTKLPKIKKEYFNKMVKSLKRIKNKYKVCAYCVNKSGAKQPAHPSPRCQTRVNKFPEEFCEDWDKLNLE